MNDHDHSVNTLTEETLATRIMVQLLNEGTVCYRPVPAIQVSENIFILQGYDIYNPEDEKWEFLPGETIYAEMRNLSDGECLVSLRRVNHDTC